MIKQAVCATLLMLSTSVLAEVSAAKAWSRITAPSVPTGAVFLQLENSGSSSDALVAASTPVSKKVEIHNHVNDNGVMRMREVARIDIPSKKTVVLQPGGYHLMLINLKTPLKLNQTFPLTLKYQSGKVETVNVTVDNGKGFQGNHSHHAH